MTLVTPSLNQNLDSDNVSKKFRTFRFSLLSISWWLLCQDKRHNYKNIHSLIHFETYKKRP